MQSTKKRCVDLVRIHLCGREKPKTAVSISKEIGYSESAVAYSLRCMIADGEVMKNRQGFFKLEKVKFL